MKLVQGKSVKSLAVSQPHWIQPEFSIAVLFFHMDVGRFLPLIAEEEKPETLRAKHRGHVSVVSDCIVIAKPIRGNRLV